MKVHVDEGWCVRMAQAEAASHPSGEIGAGRLAVDPDFEGYDNHDDAGETDDE